MIFCRAVCDVHNMWIVSYAIGEFYLERLFFLSVHYSINYSGANPDAHANIRIHSINCG